MDNSGYFSNKNDDRLGVNKIGKNIRKSPPHQPNFANTTRQPPIPQVYNINKNDFRNVVQQLTGSPSHHSQEPRLPRPLANQPNHNSSSMRLQKIRPPPLAPINVIRPQMPVRPPEQYMPPKGGVPFTGNNNNNNNMPRPAQYGQQPPPMTGATTAESPISAYMRYLQNSIIDPNQGHPQAHSHSQYQYQQRPPSYGPPFPSPRIAGSMPQAPTLPSPRINSPFVLPSPTSPFIMPSPSGYMNLLSPISSYPLPSPGYQQFPPLTPSFSFSPMGQPGIWGPGPQPPASPGLGFPSPGFFNLASPRWRG
uniref:protein HAIKU1-like n=1 Tax=Erigeron canadensis TaxID=72917 RepID=UPI001CB9A944|nr:protein HAIKU1-like [Erigeron canadensis]